MQGQWTWFNREGKVLGTVGDPGIYRVPALSPDGKQMAYEAIDPNSRNLDIWIFEFATGRNTRFTFDPEPEYRPLWSKDGKRVVFFRGDVGWFEKATDGAGDEQLVMKPAPGSPSSWSPDGRFILFHHTVAPSDVWAVDITAGSPADRKPIRVVNSPFNDIIGRFSPDGKWFSYASNETGTYEVYVRPFNLSSPEGGGKWMVSKGGSNQNGGIWRGDGKELFYLRADGMMMSVEVSTNPVVNAQVPKELFKAPAGVTWFDVSSDGKRFLMPVPSGIGWRSGRRSPRRLAGSKP